MEENWGNESKNQTTQYSGGSSYGNTAFDNSLGSNEPYMERLEEPMTMGDWFLTLIVQMIPCVGLICLIYWAFSSNVHKSKQNYCRVALIFSVIGAILCFFLQAAMMSMLASAGAMY